MQTLSFNPLELAILSAGLGLYAEYYDGALQRPQNPSQELQDIDNLISKINVVSLGDVTIIHNLIQKLSDANLSSLS
jgi:hypothetical protein